MEELNKVIINLCNDINNSFEHEGINEFVLEEAKILAELISARTKMFTLDGETINRVLNEYHNKKTSTPIRY